MTAQARKACACVSPKVVTICGLWQELTQAESDQQAKACSEHMHRCLGIVAGSMDGYGTEAKKAG